MCQLFLCSLIITHPRKLWPCNACIAACAVPLHLLKLPIVPVLHKDLALYCIAVRVYKTSKINRSLVASNKDCVAVVHALDYFAKPSAIV